MPIEKRFNGIFMLLVKNFSIVFFDHYIILRPFAKPLIYVKKL
jgi:hypothetical protein